MLAGMRKRFYEIFMNSAAFAFCFACGAVFGLDFTLVCLGILILSKMR